MKPILIAERPTESRARDILLLPVAILTFWTVAYQFVLIVRWPARTITCCFLALAIAGFFFLRRLWKKTNATPGKGHRFDLSHICLPALGIACATGILFVRRPNQDDVVYFHRALTQLPESWAPHSPTPDKCRYGCRGVLTGSLSNQL